MRQIVDIVSERAEEDRKARLLDSEGIVQTICAFIVGGYRSKRGVDAGMKQVARIRFFRRPRGIPTVDEVRRIFGGG